MSIAWRHGSRVIGIDQNEAMLARGRERVAATGLDGRIELVQGEAEALPLEDASVDALVHTYLLPYIYDPPAVLRESLADWFDLDVDSPYMLLVANVTARHRMDPPTAMEKLSWFERLKMPRSDIPAATHIDGSARIQTVHRETNPRFHDLLSAFAARTGCPVLVNTSFNVRGEPIVCTPEDAFRCFMGTRLDSLAIGNCFLLKGDQEESLARQYEQSFPPD